jgi:hypothetical protein
MTLVTQSSLLIPEIAATPDLQQGQVCWFPMLGPAFRTRQANLAAALNPIFCSKKNHLKRRTKMVLQEETNIRT